MWQTWLPRMEENAGGLDKANFAYLRDRFETFRDFASVISFLQSSAIEGGSNKRWSSKFVFPFGTGSLYEDVSVTPTGVATDRRFFARTGEILYLMLCRSARADEVRERLIRRVLASDALSNGSAPLGPSSAAASVRMATARRRWLPKWSGRRSGGDLRHCRRQSHKVRDAEQCPSRDGAISALNSYLRSWPFVSAKRKTAFLNFHHHVRSVRMFVLGHWNFNSSVGDDDYRMPTMLTT
jgi:hypothetical protein